MKKILYLCHRIPYPPNKGDKIRSFNEIKYLSKKYIVDLISLADDIEDMKYEESLGQYCRQVAVFPLNIVKARIKGLISLMSGQSISQGYFYLKAFQDTFDKWINREAYHAIICFSSPMAKYVFNMLEKVQKKNCSLIMDFCDLDSDKWTQYSKKKPFPVNCLYRTEGVRLLAFEKKVNAFFHRSVFVSVQEAELFRQYYPDAGHVHVVPNGVDYGYFNPGRYSDNRSDDRPVVGFFGAMDYYANVDGALWFARKIWPRITAKIPEARFYIVGSKPDPKLKALASDPSIRVTGFVDDIREYYAKADVCVIPLRIARGVQNKVLEAMAMEKAIVTTSPAVQGVALFGHPFLFIEDRPGQFAARTIDFLRDRSLRRRAGSAARSHIKQHFNWDTNMRLLELGLQIS